MLVTPVASERKYRLSPEGDHCGLMFLAVGKLGSGGTSPEATSTLASR